jgi:hypothetical protein
MYKIFFICSLLKSFPGKMVLPVGLKVGVNAIPATSIRN